MKTTQISQTPIKQPKYIVLEKINNLQIKVPCDHCGRDIMHVNYIKDTETGEELHLGTACTKNYTGKTLQEINIENHEFNEAATTKAKYEDGVQERKTFVQSFKEADSKMMDYIEKNLDNTFIYDMKKRIEETGTLTKNMYAVVYSMMLPVADLPDKFKDLEFTAIRFKRYDGDFGSTYILFGETDNHELVRVFFSSLNEKHNDLLLAKKIYDSEGFTFDNILDRKEKFSVSGSFDGYKIKRAKLNAYIAA